jgi:hypothetical protein
MFGWLSFFTKTGMSALETIAFHPNFMFLFGEVGCAFVRQDSRMWGVDAMHRRTCYNVSCNEIREDNIHRLHS